MNRSFFPLILFALCLGFLNAASAQQPPPAAPGPPPGFPMQSNGRPSFLPPPNYIPEQPPRSPQEMMIPPEVQEQQAAEADRPQGKPEWVKRREELEALAEEKVKERITEQSVAESLDLDWPVPAPELSLQEVEERVDDILEKMVDEKFPLTQIKQFQQEAEEEYKPWNIGDEITVELHGPRPRTIEGTLKSINPRTIQIGMNNVSTMDLDEDTLLHLLPEKLEEARQKYVRIQVNKLYTRREQYKDEIAPKITHSNFRKENYLPVRGRWYPTVLVVKKVVETRRRKAYDDVLEEVFKDNGFINYEDEWIPKEHAEIRQLMKKARGMDNAQHAVRLLDNMITKHPDVEIIADAKALREQLAQNLPPEAQERRAPHSDLDLLRDRFENGQ